VKRAALLALGVVLYAVAAWMVAPGFYDGIAPPQPYNFTCPPPQAGANSKPSSGHVDIKVIGGVSDASSAYTDDGQIVIGFLPGAFEADGKNTISVDIKPYPTCPHPAGIQFVTNIYQISATAPLAKASNLDMLFSNLLPDPDKIYSATDPTDGWQSVGNAQPTRPSVISTQTSSLGYFAAGYRSTSPSSGAVTLGGGQTLPIIVAILIVVVILAGLPVAVLKRRSGPRRDRK